jgi:hypothetical protein
MHAAKSYSNNPSSLRNQLLNTDIGNIDVRHETPIQQQQQYPQQQYPQQQHPQIDYSSEQYPQQPQQYSQSQPYAPRPAGPELYGNGPYGNTNNGQFIPPQHYHDPRSQQRHQQVPRSRRSSLTSNHSGFNNFLKMGKGRKNGRVTGLDDEEDDDGKDFVVDPSAQVMSFDDISSLRDRGRYGNSSSYDTAPIIPTLASPSGRPVGNVSNTQYRKQMTAMKKQVLTQAGKLGKQGIPDPRAMSLQTMRNPYQPQVSSRNGSFTSQSPAYMNSPRANSMNNVPQIPNGSRAYSLTTNPYQQQQQQQQQQKQQQIQWQQRRGPPPSQLHPIHQRVPYQQPPPNIKRLSAPNVPSPLISTQIPSVNNSVQESIKMPYHQTEPSQPFNQGHYLKSQAPQKSTERMPSSTSTQQEPGHHFLADNVVSGDDSLTSFDDSKEQSVSVPNGESTPSPNRNDYGFDESSESPSKLPRSQALPRLSLLNMRDDNDGFGNSGDGYVPRSLDPVDEKTTADRFNGEAVSTRESPAKRMIQRNNMGQGGHSKGVSISSMSQYSSTSDFIPDKTNSQKLYQLNQASNTNTDVFVTASQFSLMDGSRLENSSANDCNTANNAIKKATTETPDYSSVTTPILNDHSTKEFDTIRESKRGSVSSLASTQSREMKDSKKSAVKSPTFFKRWSKKRSEKKKRESFEPVTAPLNISDRTVRTSGDYIIPIAAVGLEGGMVSSGSSQPQASFSEGQDTSDSTIFGTSPHIPQMKLLEPDAPAESSYTPATSSQLADPLVPQTGGSKKLELTVEQLGIMQESTSLMRELNLVSSELAASVKREITLEEKLQGTNRVTSPLFVKEQDYASELARLVQELNIERQKRYIAEEHVLLFENGTKPSLLELSYENERLRSELSMNEELISRQSAEINALREETPNLKLQVESLTKTKKEMESVTIPMLKNQIEVLSVDNKKVMILSEKLKILKNEKLQLEKSHNDETGDFSFVKRDSPTAESHGFSKGDTTLLKVAKQRSTKEGSPLKPSSPFRNYHRPPSFSLINVTTAEAT